jgi:hypothetical protein
MVHKNAIGLTRSDPCAWSGVWFCSRKRSALGAGWIDN